MLAISNRKGLRPAPSQQRRKVISCMWGEQAATTTRSSFLLLDGLLDGGLARLRARCTWESLRVHHVLVRPERAPGHLRPRRRCRRCWCRSGRRRLRSSWLRLRVRGLRGGAAWGGRPGCRGRLGRSRFLGGGFARRRFGRLLRRLALFLGLDGRRLLDGVPMSSVGSTTFFLSWTSSPLRPRARPMTCDR